MTGAQRARTALVPSRWVLAFLVGAAVSVGLGVYGRAHDPTGDTVTVLFFRDQITMKSWLATVAVLIVVVQVTSALRLYGKIGTGDPPSWLGDVHRLSGTLAFIVSLPVAYHCLWSIGFAADAGLDRAFVHSLAGCLFYGAFATKVLAVRVKGLPGWALPLAGGLVFTGLVVAWLTSAFWFFDTQGLGF
ncbi:MAG: DUF6529 family protein [Acidimicrobiia bacterium]